MGIGDWDGDRDRGWGLYGVGDGAASPEKPLPSSPRFPEPHGAPFPAAPQPLCAPPAGLRALPMGFYSLSPTPRAAALPYFLPFAPFFFLSFLPPKKKRSRPTSGAERPGRLPPRRFSFLHVLGFCFFSFLFNRSRRGKKNKFIKIIIKPPPGLHGGAVPAASGTEEAGREKGSGGGW